MRKWPLVTSRVDAPTNTWRQGVPSHILASILAAPQMMNCQEAICRTLPVFEICDQECDPLKIFTQGDYFCTTMPCLVSYGTCSWRWNRLVENTACFVEISTHIATWSCRILSIKSSHQIFLTLLRLFPCNRNIPMYMGVAVLSHREAPLQSLMHYTIYNMETDILGHYWCVQALSYFMILGF